MKRNRVVILYTHQTTKRVLARLEIQAPDQIVREFGNSWCVTVVNLRKFVAPLMGWDPRPRAGEEPVKVPPVDDSWVKEHNGHKPTIIEALKDHVELERVKRALERTE